MPFSFSILPMKSSTRLLTVHYEYAKQQFIHVLQEGFQLPPKLPQRLSLTDNAGGLRLSVNLN